MSHESHDSHEDHEGHGGQKGDQWVRQLRRLRRIGRVILLLHCMDAVRSNTSFSTLKMLAKHAQLIPFLMHSL